MAKYGYGVDVGGTTVKMGLFTENGKLIKKWAIDTDVSNGGKYIPSDISKSILADINTYTFSHEDIIGIGIGIPGQVHKDGTADAVNLGWNRLPLIPELSAITGLRIVCDNDANMAAMGEYWMGSGRDYSSLVLVTLGTGVGGGIVVDGKCFTGAHGAGGEIGHLPINLHETRRCSCGSRGCLEQYASATGNVRLAMDLLAERNEPSILRSVGKLDAKACWDAAIAGDELAIEIADRFSDYLARGLAVVANTVDPDVILLGGGVSHAGASLVERVTSHYRQYAFPACRNTEIALAALGNDAGIYGCMYSLI